MGEKLEITSNAYLSLLQIASKMANFSLGEADLLRRAVGKKKKEILDQERNHFIQGCLANQYSLKVANEIYDLIIRFANYGFNRSHAVAYSMIAYQLAFLKANYPLFFYTSLLSSVIGNEEKIAIYIREAKQKGIKIYPPSINKSLFQFQVENNGIRYSLAAIKNVGITAVREIFEQRKQKPYTDLFDFCARTSSKIINRRVLESLILSGAFDEFGMDRAVLLANIDMALTHAELFAPTDGEQFDLFVNDEYTIKPKYILVDPLKEEEKLKYEKEVLGLYLSSHPISQYQRFFKQQKTMDIHALSQFESKYNVKVGAYISSSKVIRTKKGEVMSFFILSDETGDMDAVAFPAVYSKFMNQLTVGNILLFEGTMERRENKQQLIIKNAMEIPVSSKSNEQTLYLKIESQHLEHGNLNEVKEILKKFPGDCRVIVYYENNKKKIILPEEFSINPEEECILLLKKVIGEMNVVLKD